MTDGWVAFWAALGGGFIAGATAVGSALIQQRGERKRALLQLAFEAALEDFKLMRDDAAKAADRGKPARVSPLLVFVFHHARIAELVNSGGLNAESLMLLEQEQRELGKKLEELQRGWT